MRHRMNLNQQDLAAAMNVSRSTVAMWERGTEPSNEMLYKLADFFSVSIDTLLGRPESSSTPQSTENIEILDKFNSLDDHGKKTVLAILELEFSRCQASADDALYDKYMRKAAEDRVEMDAAKNATAASAQ